MSHSTTPLNPCPAAGFCTAVFGLIPTLDRRDLLLQAVESIKRQTYPAHEVIVVSDGGTDDSGSAVASAPDIIFIQQPNLGARIASNTGIARATGDWVCFLDDDDLWHADKLQATVNYLESHPEAQAINNPVWFFGDREDAPRVHSVFGAISWLATWMNATRTSLAMIHLRTILITCGSMARVFVFCFSETAE